MFCIEYDPILEGAAPFTSLVELVTVVRLAEGSDPEELHVSEGYPGGLALGGNQVVLAMTRSEGETENTGNIVAISRSDGATTSLGSQLPFPATPVVRDSTVYWINQGTTAGFGRFENGSIQSVPVGGGSSTTLGAGITTLAAFAVGESLYFTSVVEMQATLFSCPLAGCGEGNADATVVTSRTMEEERPPWCYAADERGLYVSEYAEPETDILWIAAGQAEPIVLASDRDCPRQIAVNSSSVLWVEQCEDSSEWTIWRMPR